MRISLKWIITGIVAVFFLVIITGSHFFTDLMWFRALGYTNLFTTRLIWKTGLFLGAWFVFGLFMLLNLWLVRKAIKRYSYSNSTLTAELSSRYLIPILVIVCLVLSFTLALNLSHNYMEFVQFLHAQSFNALDPIFHKDISFYIFKLPAYQLLVNSFLSILIIILFICAALYVMSGHFRVGHRLQLDLTTIAKRHLSVLVGLIALLIAANYHLQSFDILYNQNGVIYGAGYTDVTVRLPVLRILAVIAVVFGIVMLSQLYQYRKLLIGMVILWVSIGFIGTTLVPVIFQEWIVAPNEFSKERPYIENHINMTRLAYSINDFIERDFVVSDQLTQADIDANHDTINNIRLWDPRLILQTFRQLQEMRPYYVFNDADVDRYWIDGQLREVMLAARELDVSLTQNRNWINDHLQYTHGYGVVVSPVNEISNQQLPVFWVADIPPKGKTELAILQPRIYYGERSNDYVIVNTRIEEFDYPTQDGNAYYTYTGEGGITLSSWLHRLMFAVRFGTTRILLSEDITKESRVLFYRNIRTRVEKIAPLLRYDQDPYIIIGDDGQLYWMIDAYTVSDRFPYALPTKWGNYVRNSVKVVIDAYDGDVSFYQVEPDPLLEVYKKIYPGWIQPVSEMPHGLQAHMRYPEDLLLIQAQVYGTYHMTDPRIFYNREDVWVIANEIYAEKEQQVEPYYVVMQLPNSDQPELVLMLPFTPIRRANMIAWLAARNDQDHYGEVVVYRFPKDTLTLGPAQIDATIDQDSEISQLLSLWGQRGSQVIRGNLLVLPIKQSLLYVEPLFLKSEQSGMPQLQRVIVSYQDRLVMEPDLQRALTAIFGSGVVQKPTVTFETESADQSNSQINLLALELFKQAQKALREEDFAAFGQAWQQLEVVLEQLSNQ